MAQIQIKQHTDTTIQVGKKIVYKDQNGNWISVSELTQKETEALNDYLLKTESCC